MNKHIENIEMLNLTHLYSNKLGLPLGKTLR